MKKYAQEIEMLLPLSLNGEKVSTKSHIVTDEVFVNKGYIFATNGAIIGYRKADNESMALVHDYKEVIDPSKIIPSYKPETKFTMSISRSMYNDLMALSKIKRKDFQYVSFYDGHIFIESCSQGSKMYIKLIDEDVRHIDMEFQLKYFLMMLSNIFQHKEVSITPFDVGVHKNTLTFSNSAIGTNYIITKVYD